MKIYSLAVNDRPVLEVEVESPHWLPVRPTLNKGWLRRMVATAINEYFQRPSYHKDDLLPVAARS